MERITKFFPAFDKRSTDPKKDYGIGTVRCHMVLKGERGAVHFVFSTGMFLPETMQEYAREGRLTPTKLSSDKFFLINEPMGYDVGYHSPKATYEGQEPVWPTKIRKIDPELDEKTATPMESISNIAFDKIGEEAPVCEWIGVPCYCDGSAMRAETYMNVLLSEGSDKIWEMLEEDYKSDFGELV
jgi:hypothetical protein